ncbi:MAG: hypothetical protein K2K89_04890 [Ruminococcus sp.]|nr:hypothetical protein [Ruminococcus sp.]
MTMVSREPRQIVGFDIAFDKSPECIQNIVDNAPEAEYYCTDGYNGYVDIIYQGKHIRNIHDKIDIFTVEEVNADLRHYIPVLARRSRCLPRSLETLKAVVTVFVDAYNQFCLTKFRYRQKRKNGELPFSFFDFLTPLLATSHAYYILLFLVYFGIIESAEGIMVNWEN